MDIITLETTAIRVKKGNSIGDKMTKKIENTTATEDMLNIFLSPTVVLLYSIIQKQ